MNRVRMVAVLAAVVLAGGVPAPASGTEGEETTSVGYATEVTGLLKTLYRPPLLSGDAGAVAGGGTKTECSYDATGYGNSSQDDAYATFVARVVTSKSKRPMGALPDPFSGNLLKDEPVATGVGCELRNGETNTVIKAWEAMFPGSAAANVVVTRIGRVNRPVICVWAWLYFGDGSRHDHKKTCNPGSLL